MSVCVQVVSTAALACGLVAVGCCDGAVTPLLTTTLIEKTENELKDPYSRFMALGLGLTLLGMLSCFLLHVVNCMFCNICCISIVGNYINQYMCILLRRLQIMIRNTSYFFNENLSSADE